MKPLDPRLVRTTRAVRVHLAVTVACGVALTGLILLQAWLVARAVARAPVLDAGGSWTDVGGVVALVGVVALARAALAYGAETAALRSAAAVKSQLRRRLVAHVTGPGADPATLDPGELATLTTRGLDALDDYVARYLPQLVLAVLVPIAVLVVVLDADWLSALIIALTLPLIPVFMALVGWQAQDHTAQAVAAAEPARRALPRRRRGPADAGDLRPGQGRGRAGPADERGAPRGDHAHAAHRVPLGAGARAARDAVGGAGRRADRDPAALRAARPGDRAARADPRAGGLPAAARGRRAVPRQHGGGGGRRAGLHRPRAARPRPRTGPAPPPCPTARWSCAATGVRLTHPERTAPALDGVDLVVPAGRTLLLTGTSGAGKTTLLSVLLRFADADGGLITVNGTDLADLPVQEWRRRIAWLPQRPYLFDASVADNVRLGVPDADDAAVERAVALAEAADVVAALPDGYATRLGERGTRLSAGQRQRIALARAFLRGLTAPRSCCSTSPPRTSTRTTRRPSAPGSPGSWTARRGSSSPTTRAGRTSRTRSSGWRRAASWCRRG